MTMKEHNLLYEGPFQEWPQELSRRERCTKDSLALAERILALPREATPQEIEIIRECLEAYSPKAKVALPDWDKLTSKQKDSFDLAMDLFFRSKTNLSTTWAAIQHLAGNP